MDNKVGTVDINAVGRFPNSTSRHLLTLRERLTLKERNYSFFSRFLFANYIYCYYIYNLSFNILYLYRLFFRLFQSSKFVFVNINCVHSAIIIQSTITQAHFMFLRSIYYYSDDYFGQSVSLRLSLSNSSYSIQKNPFATFQA